MGPATRVDIAVSHIAREFGRFDVEDLESIIAALGPRETRVARVLEWAGVTGVRGSPNRCPVAGFIRLFFPEAFEITVTPSAVQVWRYDREFPTLDHQIPTPQAIRAFVMSFDRGTYPRLDDNGLSLGESEVLTEASFQSCKPMAEDSLPPPAPLFSSLRL